MENWFFEERKRDVVKVVGTPQLLEIGESMLVFREIVSLSLFCCDEVGRVGWPLVH